MSKFVPTDIISHEIFSKLPVKSLLRFKCLSKSFNALISSSEFIQLHLRESRSSDANRLLILAGADNRTLYSIDVDSPESFTTIPLPLTPVNWKPRNDIVGSVDGLICVVLGARGDFIYPEFKLVLINPSTRIFREIPCSTTQLFNVFSNLLSSFGFGFDDLNRDFKLVRISDRTFTDVGHREAMVMVYSLNKNTWKLVENEKHPKDSLMETENGVVVKNHLLHWLFLGSNHYRIGCFDIRSDKWAKDVPLTIELFGNNNEVRVRSLGVINGCLCFSTANTSSEIVWMMKEYGAKESWVKLFHINQFFSFPGFQFTQPFIGCFRRESKYEVLVTNSCRKGLFWYDIGPTTYDRIKTVKNIPTFVGGCFFAESLVQIPRGRRVSLNKLDDLF